MSDKVISLAKLAEVLGAEYRGDSKLEITGIAPLHIAQSNQLTFLDNPKYKKYLADTKAAVVILSAAYADDCQTACLIVDNPYYAYAQAASLFVRHEERVAGIHPSAVIAEDASVDASASIGPNVVIGSKSMIAANVVLSANVVIGDDCSIGQDSYLHSNVTVYHDVVIGERVRIHSSTVIGADGFGFAKKQGVWLKVAQLGGVRIGNDVEIGASTTIDRGALGDTVIADDVKLDNQIQIGHNVQVGEHTAIAGCTGVAGSTKIGRDCLIGGGNDINGHITIGDNVAIGGGSAVVRSILDAGVYSSVLAAKPERQWHKIRSRINKLDLLAKQVKHLEHELKSLTEESTLDEKE